MAPCKMNCELCLSVDNFLQWFFIPRNEIHIFLSDEVNSGTSELKMFCWSCIFNRPHISSWWIECEATRKTAEMLRTLFYTLRIPLIKLHTKYFIMGPSKPYFLSGSWDTWCWIALIEIDGRWSVQSYFEKWLLIWLKFSFNC